MSGVLFRACVLLAAAAAIAASSCDLTLSDQPPSYEDLSDDERAAVDKVFRRFGQVDATLRRWSPSVIGREYSLGPLAEDKSRIDVGFVDMWVVVNMGDDLVHLSVWENLSQSQRNAWADWFDESDTAARDRYRRFFYEFVGVHLAALQIVWVVQTPEYIYGHRSFFNVERDAQRLATPFLRDSDPSLFSFARNTCAKIRTKFDSRWNQHYDGDYYMANFRSMTDPDLPAGWIWYLCRHFAEAQTRGLDVVGRNYNFPEELSAIPR